MSEETSSLHSRFIPAFTEPDGFRFDGAYRFFSKGRSFLVSPQTGGSILLTDSLANTVAPGCLSGVLKFKLVQRGLGEIYQSRKAPIEPEPPKPCFFMIDLTQMCVLRCRYCFRHLQTNTGIIPEHTLDEICRYILNYCRKHSISRIRIQAWGGEPTLAWQRIVRICRFFEPTGVKAIICIETCGVSLTESMVREAKQYDMRIGISIDGPPDIHDAQRPLASGRGSFVEVKKGLDLLRSIGLQDLSAISVITRKSAGRINEIVEFFCRELKLKQFKFNLVKCPPGMQEDGLGLTTNEARNFAQEMFQAMIREHRAGFRSVETNLRVKILNLLTLRIGSICLSRGCHGGRKIVSINGAGDIYTCDLTDAGDAPFGNIHDGRDLIELLTEATRNHPFFQPRSKPACAVCPWHFFCMGGCTSSLRFSRGAYTGEADEIECAINQVVYRNAIQLLIEDPELLYSLAGDFSGENNAENMDLV